MNALYQPLPTNKNIFLIPTYIFTHKPIKITKSIPGILFLKGLCLLFISKNCFTLICKSSFLLGKPFLQLSIIQVCNNSSSLSDNTVAGPQDVFPFRFLSLNCRVDLEIPNFFAAAFLLKPSFKTALTASIRNSS